MCARELLPFAQDLQGKVEERTPLISRLSALVIYSLWLGVAFVCAPFFILFVAFKQVYYKFRHRRATRKNLFRRQLQKYEYLWGISRTAEAGLESCGQLILQVWLLSSHFKSLAQVRVLRSVESRPVSIFNPGLFRFLGQFLELD